jgi:hypothetical protein
MELIKYLLTINNRYCIEMALLGATKGGHYKVIMFLHNNGYEWNDTVSELAATYGHFELVKKLHEINYPL